MYVECVKAVEKCQARLPSLTSTANISQSISQVASTTTATKPGMQLYVHMRTYCLMAIHTYIRT